MMKNKKNMIKLTIFSLIIGILIITGLSIWLGFPSPYYDRTAISIIGYIIGAISTFCGICAGCDIISDWV